MTTDRYGAVLPKSKWITRSARHAGETVEVLRASSTTVKFRVVKGQGHHRGQEYTLPLAWFVLSHIPKGGDGG